MKNNKRDAGHLPDYSVRRLSGVEGAMAFILAFLGGFLAFFVFFSSFLPSIAAGILCGFLFIPKARIVLLKRRKQKLLLEFRDFLDCIYGSVSSGKNFRGAVGDAVKDLCGMRGENAMITVEARALRDGLDNGQSAGELLDDFALRSGLDEVKTFAETMKAGMKSGGNIRKTVADCREIISDRIAAQRQIEAAIAKSRGELYILAVLPFLAVLVMRLLGSEIFRTDSTAGIAAKAVSLAIFAVAVFAGKKISDVEV